MSKRDDPHCPSNLVPADYEFLFGYAHASTVDGWPVPGFNISKLCAQRAGRPFYAASDACDGEAEPERDASGRPYPMAVCHKGGACDSCGAWHIEGSVFLHVPTGECVAIGWQCADNLSMRYDASERARLKGQRKAARSTVIARKEKAAALRDLVKELGPDMLRALNTDHEIVRDIRARLIRSSRNGWSMSEKQAALVLKLAKEAAEPRREERYVPAPISDKRQTVEGTIVSVKAHDSAYGTSLKMTVKVETEDGSWLCWGTAPDSLLGLDIGNLRGARVRFDARLKAGRETHFALFSRPTKPAIVAGGENQREKLAEMERDAEYFADPDSVWASKQRRILEELRRICPAPLKSVV